MKTDIIHLETFDDIDLIRDRLEWSKADRLVLAWPKRGGIRITQLEMMLLIRKGASLGRQIAIVNDDDEISEMATAAGIPVFHSQASATLAHWPSLPDEIIHLPEENILEDMREKVELMREAAQAQPPARTLAFITGVTAIFALFIFFLPGATVHVYPAEIEQKLNLIIQANPAIYEADLAGHIPLLSMSSLQNAVDKIESSGQMPISDKFARGQVSLENLTDKTITIPEGSMVTTRTDPPVRFMILAKVEVPAGEKDVSVDIQAVLPGSSGNVMEEEIQSMEGSLGIEVTVVNNEPTTGGGESILRAPSEDDINTLREKVKSMLRAQAREAFLESEEDGQIILEDSLQIEKIVDEEISTPAGQPADTLEISLAGEIKIDYIKEDDILTAVLAAMNASMPSNYEPVDGTVSLLKTGDPEYNRDSNSLKWEVFGVRKLRSTFSSGTIIQKVTGKNVAEAVELLSGMMNHRDMPRIEMRPSWWPTLPFVPFRIEIKTD
ncbi:MAG: baseplate J/gp47 family protein [Anaerolineaceae bacterium]